MVKIETKLPKEKKKTKKKGGGKVKLTVWIVLIILFIFALAFGYWLFRTVMSYPAPGCQGRGGAGSCGCHA